MHNTQLVQHTFVEVRLVIFHKFVDYLFVSLAECLVDRHNTVPTKTIGDKLFYVLRTVGKFEGK